MHKTKIEETDGIIIIRDDSGSAKPKPCDGDKPAKQVPDWLLSANSQTEFQTHILAPEYVDGKTTGNWRVYLFRDRRHEAPIKPSEIPWDRQFESKVEAEAWISQIFKQLNGDDCLPGTALGEGSDRSQNGEA